MFISICNVSVNCCPDVTVNVPSSFSPTCLCGIKKEVALQLVTYENDFPSPVGVICLAILVTSYCLKCHSSLLKNWDDTVSSVAHCKAELLQ